jgi:3-deoxy-D-manno-octulosonate 8-phosphate phosphatase KdsC-like HAD superfamily phosphatase
MEIAGLCATPADAAADVLAYVSAHPHGFVATKPGGHGAVRNFIDAILKARSLEAKHVFKLHPPA